MPIAPIDLSDHSPRRWLWLVAGGWTAAAAVMAVVLHAQSHVPLVGAIWGAAQSNYTLGVLVWIACRAHTRLRLWNQRPFRVLSVHWAIGLVALAVWAAVQLALVRIAVGADYWAIVYAGTWMYQLLNGALSYAAGLCLGLTVQGLDREHAARQREAQLEVAARDAELAAIKAQLQPHFLLNSLNSILALIDHDPAEARGMVTRLASLLHSAFDRLEEPFVPLDRELDTICEYLEIERIRFGDRLRFTVEADRATRQVAVPPFLIQPLVENAVKHGIEPHIRRGEVRVVARLDGNLLRIAIADTGEGFNGHGSASGTGRGLELTRRRLITVYGDRATLVHAASSRGGCTMDLALPITPAEIRADVH